jgi:hypothetical protein
LSRFLILVCQIRFTTRQPFFNARNITQSLDPRQSCFTLENEAFSDSALRKRPCYFRFKDHLSSSGFTVYPTEFPCRSPCEHPMVDIAAKMGAFYWAFEYKSANDSISRGVEQLASYSESFDYVVLASEIDLQMRKSENYWRLRKIGAGIWIYWPSNGKCIERLQPLLQSPSRENINYVARKFSNLRRKTQSEMAQIEDKPLFVLPS